MIATMMQLGVDCAVLKRAKLFVEPVELSGALLIALNDFDQPLMAWMKGANPFPGWDVRRPTDPPHREVAEMAAKRFGIA